MHIVPVVLCGGSGTRLWPLSRLAYPKQFLALSGDGTTNSLFQQAVSRLNDVANTQIALGESIIVTNEEHRFLVSEQLAQLNQISATLLLEPASRNTAPALTLAALHAKAVIEQNYTNDRIFDCDPILVIAPADQTVKNSAELIKTLRHCIAVVEADNKNQTISVLGITPTSPATGYGYIKRRSEKGVNSEHDVERFVEKPDMGTAKEYLKDGSYFWNSGMFVLRASTWLNAIKEFRSDIFEDVKSSWQANVKEYSGQFLFVRPDPHIFEFVSSESIDYAVIEKCPGSRFSVKMVELNAGWNDLGAWDAVWRVGIHDNQGNVQVGDVLLENSKDSLVYASSRLVSAVGIENLVIIETPDVVMVADKKYSEDVKIIVSELDKMGRVETNLHRKVYRPWGWYDSLEEGVGFKVKRIQVNPGASLSLQMHKSRSEHWVVVKGTAEITNGKDVFTLNEGQSTYIPRGQIHRLSNPGTDPLEIIEVQSGEYLGEDDIIRLDDIYGRAQAR